MIQEKVLFLLEQKKGSLITGGSLAHTLGVSRNTIWKAINHLKDEGHLIRSVPNKGYVLDLRNDGLSKAMIDHRLKTASVGRQLHLLETVDSTNLYLTSLPPARTTHGMVAIANGQTGGRGRRGRAFSSPAGQGLYLSILLKPSLSLDDIHLFTLCSAVSVVAAVEVVYGVKPEVKWVNDILLGEGKLCGILTEASLSAELDTVDRVVVGIGINTGDIAPALEGIAASLAIETGKRGMRNLLASTLLNEFERRYLLIEQGSGADVVAEYREHLALVGEKVTIISPRHSYELTIRGIDARGALIGIDAHGDERHISAGEIEQQRPGS